MPSEEQRVLAQTAIEERAGSFRSALVSMADQVRNMVLVAQGAGSEEQNLADQEVSLGNFATDKIDIERFSVYAKPTTAVLPSDQVEPVEAALKVLNELLADADLFTLRVPEGGSLGSALARKLGNLGRVFGAAQVIELAKASLYDGAKHGHLLEQVTFTHWNAAQRAAAPPLLIEINGGDLRAASLVNFLDGGAKIALLVDGAAPPAALARVVTPGVFVQQSSGDAPLDAFAACDGAAVAAVFTAPVAIFVHDPAAGETSNQRFTTLEVPPASKLVRIGSLSPNQQKEELALLEVLTAKPAAAEGEGAETEQVDPAGRLSAWLLSQAEISNLSA
jgi:hypothetical protein